MLFPPGPAAAAGRLAPLAAKSGAEPADVGWGVWCLADHWRAGRVDNLDELR